MRESSRSIFTRSNQEIVERRWLRSCLSPISSPSCSNQEIVERQSRHSVSVSVKEVSSNQEIVERTYAPASIQRFPSSAQQSRDSRKSPRLSTVIVGALMRLQQSRDSRKAPLVAKLAGLSPATSSNQEIVESSNSFAASFAYRASFSSNQEIVESLPREAVKRAMTWGEEQQSRDSRKVLAAQHTAERVAGRGSNQEIVESSLCGPHSTMTGFSRSNQEIVERSSPARRSRAPSRRP